jgi:hypothetical protein
MRCPGEPALSTTIPNPVRQASISMMSYTVGSFGETIQRYCKPSTVMSLVFFLASAISFSN